MWTHVTFTISAFAVLHHHDRTAPQFRRHAAGTCGLAQMRKIQRGSSCLRNAGGMPLAAASSSLLRYWLLASFLTRKRLAVRAAWWWKPRFTRRAQQARIAELHNLRVRNKRRAKRPAARRRETAHRSASHWMFCPPMACCPLWRNDEKHSKADVKRLSYKYNSSVETTN